MSDIMVSVIMATYNHEHYIEKAIQSVLMQKVNFAYEVILADDCSQDHTQEVLKRLEPSLPNNFHIICRSTNMGDSGRNNFKDLYSRVTGKYVIALEGDDYWTYDQKLQRQVDFLEAHPDYSAVAHNTLVVDHDGNIRNDYKYPECKKEEYTFRDYEDEILPGQTTTIMYRNIVHIPGFHVSALNVDYPGDRHTVFMLLCNGRVKCLQERWSAYRYVPEFGSSFSARTSMMSDNVQILKGLRYHEALLKFARNSLASNTAAIQSAEAKYMLSLLVCVLHKTDEDSTWHNWLRAFMNVKYKMHSLEFLTRMTIKRIFSGR